MPPIVLLHGFPFDHTMWRSQVDFLRGAGFSVLTPDFPGFGAAPPWPKGNCSMEAYARSIHDLIQNEAGGRAVVGGLSMGGYVALALLREFPQALAGIMLIDTRAEADTPEGRDARLASIQIVESQGVEPLANTMLSRVLSRRASLAVRQQARAIMLRQSPEGVIGAQLAMSRRQDQTSLLAEIKIPTLIVVGADDAVTPPSVAMAMHTHISGSMLVQVANAGHMSNLEAPDAVNRAMATFLALITEPAA